MGSEHKKGGISVDWNKLKAEYIAGGTSYRKLAEKYGVSENTLRRRAAKEKWTQERHKSDTKVTQKIIEIVSDENAEEVASAITLINESAMNMLRQINRETAHGISDYRDFSTYSRALKQLKEVLDIKSENDMEEQQARIDNLRRQADADKTKDNVVEFEFAGDTGEYAE